MLTEDEIAEAIRYGNNQHWLEQHDNCLRAIPADHPDRPRVEEQRRLLRQQMDKQFRAPTPATGVMLE